MSENLQRATLAQVPRQSQSLKLICCRCGDKAPYDVGTIACDKKGEGPAAKIDYAFTNYFRCRACGSPGPWEIADGLKLLGLTVRSTFSKNPGIVMGKCALFDGTEIQTPAMGEEYLRQKIEQQPRDAFLHTRLGNLLRGAGQTDKAEEWYQQALRLDPHDIEARYHLFRFAHESGDFESLLLHGPRLVRSLLQGRGTEKEDLTEGIAYSIVELLRSAPEQFRAHFLGPAGEQCKGIEDLFIRTLLQEEGEEDEIIDDGATRLLAGEPTPAFILDEIVDEIEPPNPSAPPEDTRVALVSSLQTVVEAEGLQAEALVVAVETDDQGKMIVRDRHRISITDAEKAGLWSTPSLRELFRGNRTPPADIEHYPPAYRPYFFFIEEHVMLLCEMKGEPTDQQLEEIYGALRRRPDGRSLGEVHDFMWQVAALLLGKYELSEAEFEGLFGSLALSAKHWAERPVSRNYVAYLRNGFTKIR